MPRITRNLADGYIYHVLNRGNGKQAVFRKDQDYRVFLELMGEAKERQSGVSLLAYCLMVNHFHFVLQPAQGEELSKWMQWLMTTYVRRYHLHYETSGHVWQGRYKSFVVQDDPHLLTVLRYVEGNPVRAGLVASAADWQWSSHRERIGQRARFLVDDVPVELPQDWGKYVDEPLTDRELDRLRTSVTRQAPYGSPQWQRKAVEELRLESTLRPPYRPKKGVCGNIFSTPML